MSVYEKNGYNNRDEYLNNLASNMGLDISVVYLAADMLGPNEDFDGLVTTLEDHADRS